MAKRRKTTKRKSTRRRVSGINSGSIINTLGGVIAGVAAAGYLNKLVLKNQSGTIQAIGPVALGIAIPSFLLKNDFGKFLGAGMVAYGAGKFLAKAGLAGSEDDVTLSISGDDLSVIAGDDDDSMAGDYAMAGDFAMAGDENISVLAGTNDLDEAASIEADEEYYSNI